MIYDFFHSKNFETGAKVDRLSKLKDFAEESMGTLRLIRYGMRNHK